MNGTFEDYDEALAEDYDETAESFDDESFDEPAEFLGGFLQNLLPGPIRNLINPQPTRPPLPGVQLPDPGSGVSNATLNTPAGQATIALPSPLVRQDEFRAATTRLQASINRNTSRLNTVTGDVGRLRSDFIRVETDTRAQVTKLRTDTRKALVRSRKEQAAALVKLRKDQSSQQTTNLMMTLMMQQQVQSQFTEHTHAVSNNVAAKPTGGAGANNMMFLLLPLLMTGEGGGGDNMMLPMMMMVMANQNR